jgi:hypothetical protein
MKLAIGLASVEVRILNDDSGIGTDSRDVLGTACVLRA